MKIRIVLVLAGLFFGVTNGSGTAPASTKITIGYATISGASAALWVAQDEKLLNKNGIEADLVFMPGSPTLIAAINSGSLAVGYTGGTATLGAAASGVDFKTLEAPHGRVMHDLVEASRILKSTPLAAA